MEKIKIHNLAKSYANHCILHQTNVSFYSGEIIGLIGENGVGKTTFIKLLCGLVSPDNGQILIDGTDNQKNRIKCMQRIGVLLEGSRSIYWRLSAWQNFIYFSGLKGIFGQQAYENAKHMFKLLGLWDIKDKKAENFSFGMKQRLALACSIPHQPSIILLDEPTTGLDMHSHLILENLIKQLSDEDRTIVIASHDHDMIKRISHKIFKIEDGLFNNIY